MLVSSSRGHRAAGACHAHAYSTQLIIPFLEAVAARPGHAFLADVAAPLVSGVSFRFWFSFAIVIVGSSNAVNLTDGLDGLAIGCTVIAAGALTVLTYVSSNYRWATYLDIRYIPRVGELTVFCGALVGASLGFLWYNAHPAEIFMGDVGSLSLGGTLGIIAVIIKQEILAVFRRRNFCHRSALGDPAGRLVQAARQTDFSHGADASSF